MKANIAAVGLGHPFEVGFSEAPALLNTTVDTLTAQGINCVNVNVVMHDLDTVKQAAEALKQVDMDVLLICIATWSEDHHLLDLLSYIDKPVSELIAAIGEPQSSDYAPSCLNPGQGEDGMLYYDGFVVYTYKEGDTETVQDVE